MNKEKKADYVTRAEFESVLKRIAKAIGSKLAPFEKRITELERRPALTYKGVWNADTQFNEGDCCSDHGSTWFCKKSTRARPGDDPDSWTLMVKKGRDAR